MADEPGKYDGKPERKKFPREDDIVQRVMRLFSELQTWRNVFAGQWEEAASLILPTSRNTFFYGSFNWQGQKKTEQQVDASGMLALHRFGAILDSLLTPSNMTWHQLTANDEYVMKDRATRLWFEQVTRILFKYRYQPIANFSSQNQNNYQSLGAFGNGTMYIDAFDGRLHHGMRGLRYKSVPLGETFFGENHQGVVDRIVRWFRLTAHQAAQKWGEERLPPALRSAYEKDNQYPYDFLHCVCPREEDDYDPQRIDARGKPFASYYISVQGQCMMQEEGGYNVFPYAPTRYDQTPGEVYGRGPTQMVLPALKTLNAQKRTFLKQGHRAADPVLLTADDGLIDGFSMRPGALNKGGVSPDGKPLIHILPTGNVQVSEKMMDMERGLIDDVFLVALFRVLMDHPNMTATQVIEIVNEKGILIAPTVGRQQSEYLGPMIEREIAVMADQRLLPPPPPRLREARGEYSVVYTNRLARAQQAEESAGFVRTVEWLREVVNVTQDVSILDRLNFDTAVPEIAVQNGTPVRWLNDDNTVAQKAKMRARQAQQKQAIDAMPAQAAMIKARAVEAKAGVAINQGGQMQPQSQGVAA